LPEGERPPGISWSHHEDIFDNYCTHKHAKVRAWLERHPRWTFHFIPTSSSWLDAIEGFFAKLTRRRLKRGVFHSVVDLQAAINRFTAEHNETKAKLFIWRADPDEVVAARNRGFQMLDSIHSHVRHFKGSAREMFHLRWQAFLSSGCPCAKQEARSMRRRLIML
jgi:hypothetical protein